MSTMPATLAVKVARGPSTVRRLLRRPAAALALAVVGAFVLIALGAPWLAPFDPIATISARSARRRPRCIAWAPTR